MDEVLAKVKQGNKIGENSLEVNIGIFKLKIVRVACDNMENRICYEKKGEETGKSAMVTTEDSIYSGIMYSADVINEYDNYTITDFKFYADGFYHSSLQ